MNYCCDVCNYETLNHAHWNRHIESDKHKKNSEANNKKTTMVIKCQYCNISFTKISNLYRHQRTTCVSKIITEKEIQHVQEINKLKQQMLEIQVAEMKKQIEKLEHANTQMHETNKISSTTLDKSVSALTYLTTTRKKAPVLQQITQEKAKELLHYEKRLYDFILHHNSEGTLDQYIGDIILKYIKKEDPDEQSVWNSDVSRLTYLVRCLVEDEQKWQRDAKGVLFSKYVITPIIKYLTEYLRTCLPVIKVTKPTLEKPLNDLTEMDDFMYKTKDILETIETLKSKKLKSDLLLHIASHVPLIQAKSKSKK
jgi:hypothetical protein